MNHSNANQASSAAAPIIQTKAVDLPSGSGSGSFTVLLPVGAAQAAALRAATVSNSQSWKIFTGRRVSEERRQANQ